VGGPACHVFKVAEIRGGFVDGGWWMIGDSGCLVGMVDVVDVIVD